MKVFASKQFLLLISAATLRQYTEAHVLYPRLTVDWSLEPATFATLIHDAVDALDVAMSAVTDPSERKSIQQELSNWHDDLRRAHLLSNRLAIQELRSAIGEDAPALDAIADLPDTEIPLWMLAHRDAAFRNVELYLAFQAKSNGKYWKKHAIQPGLTPTREREDLEAFSSEVSKLYQKVGGGKSSHVEVIEEYGLAGNQQKILLALMHARDHELDKDALKDACISEAQSFSPSKEFQRNKVVYDAFIAYRADDRVYALSIPEEDGNWLS